MAPPSPPGRADEQPADDQPVVDEQESAPVAAFTVGTYTRRDPVTGDVDEGSCVVAESRGGVLVVWPVANFTVQVDRADFARLADDA